MRREASLLYLCCTQDLPSERLEEMLVVARTPSLDWSTLFSLAHDHGVAPLVSQNLQHVLDAGVAIPAEVVQRFKLATYQNALAKQKQAERLAYALEFLQANQIDALICKGVALDLMVYDQPWYTVAQDIDLVLRPRCTEWRQKGIAQLQTRLDGLGIEYELDSHHDVTLNGSLPVDFGRIWGDASQVEFGGYPVYLMAPEDMLLAVCINSCRKRYFWLRSLCDIAETTKRFPHLDWHLFAQKAIAYGCNNIVYTAFSVVAATLPYVAPPQVIDSLAVGAFKRLAIDKAIQYLVGHIPLRSLSHYTGSQWIGRKIGWSLLLPYITYRRQQMASKVHEAVTTYLFP